MKHVLIWLSLVALAPETITAQTVASVKRQMIQQSIERYPGSCPCPYSRARNGSRCGGRSAWSRPGGYAPLCYGEDITDRMVRSWMQRNNMLVDRSPKTRSPAELETVRQVQIELNRLGCDAGQPDGIIGANSRRALERYARVTGVPFRVADFRSQLFLRRIENQVEPTCS